MTFVWIVETLQQMQTRWFTIARISDQRNGLTAIDFQIQTIQNLEKNGAALRRADLLDFLFRTCTSERDG